MSEEAKKIKKNLFHMGHFESFCVAKNCDTYRIIYIYTVYIVVYYIYTYRKQLKIKWLTQSHLFLAKKPRLDGLVG